MSREYRREESKRRNKVPFLILIIVLVIVLAVVIFLSVKGQGANSDVNADDMEYSDDYPEKWQEGVINYKGKDYLFNQDIKSYLIMGVDKADMEEDVTNYTKGGQSDAMFLLVTNSKDRTMSVVSINRNTMTRVETCSIKGTNMGYVTAQICLQHAYGDGKNLSCVRSTEAVSYLFYNLPINGYLAMSMDGMPIMNDSIGGVEITVLEDLTNTSKGVSLKKGETVTLTGDEAYVYLRTRDIEEFDSASNRLRRQEQYITAYMDKLEKIATTNPNKAIEIYEALEEYTVSSIDFAGLVGEVKDYEFSSDNMYTIPGETRMGTTFEEYYVDEDAFYEMIIDIFYEEVTE